MILILNGTPTEVPALSSVAELSAWLKLPAFGSAVELNGQVVPKATQPATPLTEGDRLEIVRLVGGG